MPDTPSPNERTADSDYLTQLRKELEEARQTVRDNHLKMPGLQLAHLYAHSLEQMLVRHVERVMEESGAPHLKESISLIAVGGFGRRELALHSDIDFLFLTEREPNEEEEEFIKAAIRPLFDLRIDLGYGVHSVRQVLGFLGHDPTKATALLALRHLWGSEMLSEELQERLHARIHKHFKLWFVRSLEDELRQRHAQHGDTVFLLEPDLKLSPGGLRDIHQILWIAFASYGVLSLEVLVENGVLSEGERSRLNAAWSFIMEVRNTLHIMVNRRVDKLTLERQLRVAEEMQFEQTDVALSEEQLMRTYYAHAMTVRRIAQRLLTNMLVQTPGTEEATRQAEQPRVVDRDFWMRGGDIWMEDGALPRLDRDPFWMMRFFLAAVREGLVPRELSLRRIEQRLDFVNEAYRKSPVPRDSFMTILRTPGRLAETLRHMHHCGFLGRYLPEFALVRYLPRIDHYHQFTVDEHLIRSVHVGEQLISENPPQGMDHVADVARDILRIDLLFLSLLLHDVGKGEGRAHVIRGMHIAQRIGERLGFRPVEQDLLRNLVANHQKMSHMALRRDIEDPGVVRELAEAVGDPEELRMLYVHTACDMRAVSDESWNEWRGRLLALLFERALDHLRGVRRERGPRLPLKELRDQMWEELARLPDNEGHDRAALERFLSDMPSRYINSTSPSRAVVHFLLSSQLSEENRIAFRVDQYEGSRLLELTFVARTEPGLFANLCGAMAAKRFNIQFAQIYTTRSGEAVDIFQVEVPPTLIPSVEELLTKICERMNHMLRTGQKARWTDVIDRTNVLVTQDRLKLRPPQVDTDNDMSPHATVIKVSAPDRPGLLSEIAGVFDKYGINIDTAYIATESYQVVDTFYVTDLETNKLSDEGMLERLRQELLDTIVARLPVELPATGEKSEDT